MLLAERGLYFPRVRDVAVLGREGYFYFPTDARFVSNAFIGVGNPPKLDANGFYSGNWNGAFAQVRNARNLIGAASSSALGDAQKKAASGFAKTFSALALMHVLETRFVRDAGGGQRQPERLRAFVSRDSAFKFVSALLDEAKADLQASTRRKKPMAPPMIGSHARSRSSRRRLPRHRISAFPPSIASPSIQPAAARRQLFATRSWC